MFFDAELTGFALRVTAAGRKLFLFQYRPPGGAVRRIVLGEYGTLTPTQARARAEVLRGQVTAGGDPVAEREATRAAAAAAVEAARSRAALDALTFGVLVERWRDLRLSARRERYRREAVRALLAGFPTWHDRAAHMIAPAEAVTELDRIAAARGPHAARLALAYGRAMYNWAVGRRMLAANPFAGIPSPARAVERDRVLSDDELGAVWRAAGLLGWPFGPFVQLLALTLQRRDEVAGMRWSELSSDLTLWTIPAERAKNRRAHLVHLAPAARAILRELPRHAASDLVFTTTGRAPISGYSRAKALLDQVDAMPLPWRLHDFRRTGVTGLAALGFPPHVCDRLLNHVKGSIQGVAAVYQRNEFLPERRRALEAWARHVLAVAEGGPAGSTDAKVVPLPRRHHDPN